MCSSEEDLPHLSFEVKLKLLNIYIHEWDFPVAGNPGCYIIYFILQCLLVKGWKAGASWSFPRGKRSKDEEDHTCAVREVNAIYQFLLRRTHYIDM